MRLRSSVDHMTVTEMLTQGFSLCHGRRPVWDGTTWELFIRGSAASPLFEARNKTYKADKRVAKYNEVTEYIKKSFARLQ